MDRPFIIVCGAPKLGKTTEAFKAFQNSLCILSSSNNPHYYAKLLRTRLKDVKLPNGEPKYRPPKKVKLIDLQMTGVSEDYSWLKPGDAKPVRAKLMADDTGRKFYAPDPEGEHFMPVSQIAELERTLISVVRQTQMAIDKKEKPKYDNLLIDEWGEFMDRVHAEITPTCLTNNGKVDTRGAFLVTTEWMQKVVGWMKQLTACGVGVCLVMHDREPDNGKKGGPKGPSANISRKLVGLCDGAIQRVMKDPEYGATDSEGKLLKSQRLWKASASELWDIGLRGLDEEDEDRIATMELEEVLELAGFIMRSE